MNEHCCVIVLLFVAPCFATGCSWVEKRQQEGGYKGKLVLISWKWSLVECKDECLRNPFCEAISWKEGDACYLHPPKNWEIQTTGWTYIEFGAECKQTPTHKITSTKASDEGIDTSTIYSVTEDDITHQKKETSSPAPSNPNAEPDTTVQATTDKPEEKKPFDWLYWLFTFIFFALLPVLVYGTCRFRKGIMAKRAEERRLKELRNAKRKEHAQLISNRKLKEERNTDIEAQDTSVEPQPSNQTKPGTTYYSEKLQKHTRHIEVTKSKKKIARKHRSVKASTKAVSIRASRKTGASKSTIKTMKKNNILKSSIQTFKSVPSTPQTWSKTTKGLRNKSLNKNGQSKNF